jgi:hypothetical protein
VNYCGAEGQNHPGSPSSSPEEVEGGRVAELAGEITTKTIEALEGRGGPCPRAARRERQAASFSGYLIEQSSER